MLVLTRKKDQVVEVGDIKIIIVDIKGKTVRLGIEAPAEIPIRRVEKLEKPDENLQPRTP